MTKQQQKDLRRSAEMLCNIAPNIGRIVKMPLRTKASRVVLTCYLGVGLGALHGPAVVLKWMKYTSNTARWLKILKAFQRELKAVCEEKKKLNRRLAQVAKRFVIVGVK